MTEKQRSRCARCFEQGRDDVPATDFMGATPLCSACAATFREAYGNPPPSSRFAQWREAVLDMFRLLGARNHRTGRWDWTALAVMGGLFAMLIVIFVTIAAGLVWWQTLLACAPFAILAFYGNHRRNVEMDLLISHELRERAGR